MDINSLLESVERLKNYKYHNDQVVKTLKKELDSLGIEGIDVDRLTKDPQYLNYLIEEIEKDLKEYNDKIESSLKEVNRYVNK